VTDRPILYFGWGRQFGYSYPQTITWHNIL